MSQFVYFAIPPGVHDMLLAELPPQKGDSPHRDDNFQRYAALSMAEIQRLGMLETLCVPGRALDLGSILQLGIPEALRDWVKLHRRNPERAMVIEHLPGCFQFPQRFEVPLPRKG